MFLKGIFWDLVDKILNQGIGFIISIFLARILTPEDFGLVGMVMVVVNFSQVFMDMGFSTALIQKQEITEEQYSTIFYLNVLVGGCLTCLMFFLSEPIARFYDQSIISSLIKGISLLFFINSLSIIQTTQYLKAINLKPPALFRGIAVAISGGVGIAMAYSGFGVWSLIAQSLLNAIIFTILIWVVSNWRPMLYFRLTSIKELWNYGYKIFLSGFLENIFSRLDVLIIGKIFNPTSLGFYTRAQSLNNLVVQYSSGSLLKVFFPAITKHQNDTIKVSEVYSRTLIIVSFAALGLLSVLFVCASHIIVLLFTEKWLPSVKYFKILVLGGYAYPLSSIMVNVISARGKSGEFLKLEILKKVILTINFIIGFQIGISAFLYGLAIFSFLAVLLNMYFVSKELSLTVLKQIRKIAPYFVIAIISSFSGLVVSDYISVDRSYMLIIEAGTVISVYLLLNFIIGSNAILLLKENYRILNKVNL
jgi:teichuronic acid exporter